MQGPGRSAWSAGFLASGAAALWAALAAPPAAAAGQGDSGAVLSDQQIEQALKPAATHSFATRGLRRRTDADTEAAPPEATPTPAAAPAAVNLNIPFEYNASTLKPEASTQLRQLEHALNSDALRADRFLVAGHTDAKGSAVYNKRLSLRRAESVKQFLVAHGVEASRMNTVGFGSEQLLVPGQPEDPRNRRVEIRDLGAAP